MSVGNQLVRQERATRTADWPAADDPCYGGGPPKEVLEAFARQLVGEAVFPWSPGYDQDRQGNPLYPASPEIIVYCETPADVALSLAFAKRWQYTPTCRSGGHSTAGFSLNNSMVIDVSRFSYVSVDPEARLARVGAGTQFQVLDSVLDSWQLHVPGGGCGTVCVGGYVQGGGYGFTSRMFGMASDNVVELTVMLPNGTLVVASADSADATARELFWAIRGGTGNQFGVLLEVVYRLVPMHDLWGFAVVWDTSHAATALDALQRVWMRGPRAPKRLGHQVALASIDGRPSVAMLGMWNGSRETGKQLIDPFQQATGGVYREDKVDSYLVLNEGLLEILDPPVPGLIELKQAGYLTRQLGVTGWQAVWDAYLHAPSKYGIALIEAYGGHIAEVPASASAFVHRAVDGDFFVDSFFTEPGTGGVSRETAQKWLDSVMAAAGPGLSGAVYQNYPNRGLEGYKEAYWPGIVTRLEALKRKVDPDGLLNFEQTV